MYKVKICTVYLGIKGDTYLCKDNVGLMAALSAYPLSDFPHGISIDVTPFELCQIVPERPTQPFEEEEKHIDDDFYPDEGC